MRWFGRLSLAQRYSLLSFLLIFGAMLVVGAWTGQQIQTGVLHRTADLTALYVDSLVSHHLRDLLQFDTPDAAQADEVKSLLGGSPIGRSLAAYKIWAPDGRIVYSSEPAIVGRQYPVEGGLRAALSGSVHTEITDLNEPEEIHEKHRWPRLIDTYAPLSRQADGQIFGAIEFYQTTDALSAQIRSAQIRSWLVLGAAAIVIYLLLARLIFGASSTISRQQNELHEKVTQLTALLAQNEQLHSRVSRAAARATALNERFLSRISADLHDGPGQDLALALLRIDELAAFCESCRDALRKKRSPGDDFGIIRTALKSALADMRATLSGLRLPEVERLSLRQTAERAVRDFERKTGATVKYSPGDLPDDAPLSVKITLFRILQEALSNSYLHTNGASQHVSLNLAGGELVAEIADSGSGFDARTIGSDHLGLAGMRERAEILGGLFEMESTPGRGTVIRTWLPLDMPEDRSD